MGPKLNICVLSTFIFFISATAQQGGQVQQNNANDDGLVNLAEHEACSGDVQRLCRAEVGGRMTVNNSLAVLECFLNHEDTVISAQCHKLIWDFKLNVTKDPRIAEIAKNQCANDLNNNLRDCNQHLAKTGEFISCIVEEKDRVLEEQCHAFINRLSVVVFSDYRLVGKFAETCKVDIARLDCARQGAAGQSHSQGAVINCLAKRLQEEEQLRIRAYQANDEQAKAVLEKQGMVDKNCAHQVLRLMELQSDDFHLDRALFFACRDDREALCHGVPSGQGRVYQCLLQHKMDDRMSSNCKEHLSLREKSAQLDYKVDYGLGQVCKAEIDKHQCLPPPTENTDVGMSYVILCLEGIIHKQGLQSIGSDCVRAMQFHREAMMADYSITPNIVVFCKKDMEDMCKNVHPKGMIHCLMGVANQRKAVGEGRDKTMESLLSPQCGRELENLLLAADPSSNVHVDIVLYQACHNIIDASCARVTSTPKLMGCLMEHMHLPEMTDQCERHLLETHYFVTRDIRLDGEVFQACRKEAEGMCNLKDDWVQRKQDQKPESGPLTFSCLYRHAFEMGPENGRKMSQECKTQLQSTMHQRALVYDLPPGVDVQCIHDLAYFCTDATNQLKKGEEFICLQKNYNQLQQGCQTAVYHFTQAIDKDIKLSATYVNCAPALDKFCHDKLTKESTFHDAMDCLIPNRDDPGMPVKCQAEIDHYELISMNQYKLNLPFKESCEENVKMLCPGKEDIGDIVLCLSSINREDVINEKAPRLSKACREQLRRDLLARSEHPNLDPIVQKNCAPDIKMHCPVVSVENLLECLRGKSDQLSSTCHKTLFKIEEAQAVDPKADSVLVKACRRAIEKYCRDEEDDKILPCLVDAKRNNLDIDPKCARVVLSRQVEEAKDIRLNPALFKDCKDDTQKFCGQIMAQIISSDKEDSKLEYKLISCLKDSRKAKKHLSDSCEQRLTAMMKDAALYYKLDPHLADVCHDDIGESCNDLERDDTKGEVLECLKKHLAKNKIKNKECRTALLSMVSEGKADIHVDPILYTACQPDLQRHCHDVLPGEGRQFQCLIDEMNDGKKSKLQPHCLKLLQERVALLQYAAKSAPETVEQLVEVVTESKARYYFLSVLGGMVLGILVIGICCGRATKRIRRELKNR